MTTGDDVEGRLRALVATLADRLREVLSLFDDPCPFDTGTTLTVAKIALLEADALLAAPVVSGPPWQPIETAPRARKVIVTWVNALGKRRTAMASFWPEGALDMSDDVPAYQVNEEGRNVDAGWWEESEGNDDAMFRLVEKMTHWMPLPSAPLGDTRPERTEQTDV